MLRIPYKTCKIFLKISLGEVYGFVLCVFFSFLALQCTSTEGLRVVRGHPLRFSTMSMSESAGCSSGPMVTSGEQKEQRNELSSSTDCE